MDKIIITRPIVGIYAMQVCADNEATDEEILKFVNEHNPAGTENGWAEIVRNDEKMNPVKCANHPETRTHYMIYC